MNKLVTINILLTVLFFGCKEPKNITMNMPDTMPPLLQIQTGLNPELKEKQVVFEKYVQTRMGNAEAKRLYANGDFYEISLGYDESLKEDNISWNKVGVISQHGLDEIQEISKNSVVDYINNGPHKIINKAVEDVNWYFYFDNPIFVQTQLRQWRRAPRFVRKIDKAIEQNLTIE